MHPIDHIADGTNGLEFVDLELSPGQFLKFYDEIDCVDAVEIEIFRQSGIRLDLVPWDLEHFLKIGAQPSRDVFTRQHWPCPHTATG